MTEIKQWYHRLPFVLGNYVDEKIEDLSRLNKITIDGTEEKSLIRLRLNKYINIKKDLKKCKPITPSQELNPDNNQSYP